MINNKLKYMLTYGTKYSKLKVWYSNDFKSIQNKAEYLRSVGYTINKMGLTQSLSTLEKRIK